MNMETNNQNQPLVSEVQSEEPQKKNSGGTGAFIGSLIIILVIIIGGIYMWNEILERANPQTELDAESLMAGTEESSDETASLEAELENSDFADLDAELNAIDAEFEAN